MSDKKPGGLKLKLRKADTNRLKTETGRVKKVAEEAAPAEAPVPASPPPPPPPEKTAEIRDPMALRDTSQGKLKRIQSPDETASAVPPPDGESGDDGIKRETVRLKVVRDKKRGGPQPLPGVGEGPAAAVDQPATPSAQTVKISLPGLKKPSAPEGASPKHATATVRVQDPPAGEQPDQTLKVAPPASEEGENFRDTSTATLKVGQRKVAPSGPGGTIKIKPGPALAAKSATGEDQKKQMTATLKVRPTAEPPPEPSAESSNKQVTATLKVRSGEKEADDASSTVRITPPAEPNAEEDSGEGKGSLRLKRPAKPGSDAGATVRLPGLEEAAEAATPPSEADTVVAGADETAGEDSAPPAQKGLKLKVGKKQDKDDAAEAAAPDAEAAAAPEAEAEAEPALSPRPAAGGPGVVAAIGSLAACGALGALLYRLIMDFIQHIQY